jgi:hypothetical protein
LPLDVANLAAESSFDPCRDCGIRVLSAVHLVPKLFRDFG